MNKASDELLLSIGNQACDVLSTSRSFGQAVQDLTKGLESIKVTTDQTSAVLRQAVANLCPQYKSLIP